MKCRQMDQNPDVLMVGSLCIQDWMTEMAQANRTTVSCLMMRSIRALRCAMVPLVPLVPMGELALKVRKESEASKESKAHRENKAHRESKAHRENKANLVKPVRQVLRAPMGRLGRRVNPV